MTKRNRFIDVLKGICIIFVIITHLQWTNEEYDKFFFNYWRDMAVPILMIVSGYVYSLSFERKRIENMSDAYSVKTLVTPIIRYTLPYVIFFITQLTVVYLIPHKQIGLLNIISLFIQGGIGPGSYYYPILIQFVFLFPLIYFTVKNTV